MSAILSVQDIHTYYGDSYVLQGMSLEIQKGEALGILGRNGMGKTTMINSIMGFVPPRRGQITFQGKDITHSLDSDVMPVNKLKNTRPIIPVPYSRATFIIRFQKIRNNNGQKKETRK